MLGYRIALEKPPYVIGEDMERMPGTGFRVLEKRDQVYELMTDAYFLTLDEAEKWLEKNRALDQKN